MRRMGLLETDENHPVLGNVKLSLEALVQQRFVFAQFWKKENVLIRLSRVLIVEVLYFFFLILSLYIHLCRYLQKDKVSGPEGNTIMYELAERALDGEVNQQIKDYITQVHPS